MFATIVPLFIFLFPLAYSPGPGNMFFAANGARYGVRATLAANAGYHLATWIVTFAIGAGFLWVVGDSSWVLMAAKIFGAAYVLWIAWKMFMAPPADIAVKANKIGAWDGVVLLLLNPKAYVIITLLFSQFLEPDHSGNYREIVIITTVFTLNNFVAFLVWTTIGEALARRFRDETQARWLNRIFGSMLGAVAVWMLVV